jgi:hypothetical protein
MYVILGCFHLGGTEGIDNAKIDPADPDSGVIRLAWDAVVTWFQTGWMKGLCLSFKPPIEHETLMAQLEAHRQQPPPKTMAGKPIVPTRRAQIEYIRAVARANHKSLARIMTFIMGVRVNSASSERGFSAQCGFQNDQRAKLAPETVLRLQQMKVILSDIKMKGVQRNPSSLGSISKDARELLFNRRGNADPGAAGAGAAAAAASQAQAQAQRGDAAQRGGGDGAAAAAAAAAAQGGGDDDEVQLVPRSREDLEEEEEKKMDLDLRYAAMGVVITCAYLVYSARAACLPTLQEAQQLKCCVCNKQTSQHADFTYSRTDGLCPAVFCPQCSGVYHPGCASIDEGAAVVVAMKNAKPESKLTKSRCPHCVHTISNAQELFWFKASHIIPHAQDELVAGNGDDDDDNEDAAANDEEQADEYDGFPYENDEAEFF